MIKRIFSLALVMATAAAFIPYVVAGELEDAKPEVSFYAMQRMRYESGNNYFDLNSDINDRFDFWTSRTLVGMKTMLARDVWSKVELQHIGSFGNQTPQRSNVYDFNAPFHGPLGQNTDPQGVPNGIKQNEVELYRAEVGMDKIGGSSLGIALGRQEYTVGGNLVFGNEPFYNGTVFDGLSGSYDFKSWRLTGIYFVTQERQDPASLTMFSGRPGNEDQKVGGFDGRLTLNDGENDNWGDVQPYVYYAKDGNSDPMLHLEETVAGAWWGRDAKTVEKVKANPMSWSIEYAHESGSQQKNPTTNSTNSFSGWIAEGHFGWNFLSHDRIIHRPEAGFIMTPGDDDLTNSETIGWSQKFGDVHCRYGCTDFFGSSPFAFESGITAWWVGYTIMTNPGRHMGYIKYWDFKPTEDSIKVNPTGPKLHIGDFGTEYDLGYSYGYSANAKLFVTYAQLKPDDGLKDLFTTTANPNPSDNVERIYGGLWLKFH